VVLQHGVHRGDGGVCGIVSGECSSGEFKAPGTIGRHWRRLGRLVFWGLGLGSFWGLLVGVGCRRSGFGGLSTRAWCNLLVV
jgi:hypothetical protein